MSFEFIEIKNTRKKNLETKNDKHSYRYEKNLIICSKKFNSIITKSKKIYKGKQKNDRELSIKKQNITVNQKHQNRKIIEKIKRQTTKFFQNVEINKK